MKNLVSKIRGAMRGFRKLGRHPVLDWYFSLVAFFFAIVLVLVTSGFIYLKLGHVEVVIPLTESAENDDGAFDARSIEKTLDALGAKKEESRNIPGGVRQDPSR